MLRSVRRVVGGLVVLAGAAVARVGARVAGYREQGDVFPPDEPAEEDFEIVGAVMTPDAEEMLYRPVREEREVEAEPLPGSVAHRRWAQRRAAAPR
jgi:hypothetical protein